MCKIGKLKKQDLEFCFHCGKPADKVYMFGDEIIDVCDDCNSALDRESGNTARNDSLLAENPIEVPNNNHLRETHQYANYY